LKENSADAISNTSYTFSKCYISGGQTFQGEGGISRPWKVKKGARILILKSGPALQDSTTCCRQHV